jgi:hypothetical protein
MKKIILLLTCIIFSLTLLTANSQAQDKKKTDKKKTEAVKTQDKAKKVEKTVKNTDKSTTVYVLETGKAYHKKNCKLVKSGKKGITLEEAKKQEYTPCKLCNPPK